MVDALFNHPGYAAVKKMLDATVLRHEAIASNLANVETPGYKRVDLSPNFQSELKQAMNGADSAKVAALQPAVSADSSAGPGRLDGNNVQLESELLNLNQNTVEHALETQLVTAALLRLRLAITGRAP